MLVIKEPLHQKIRKRGLFEMEKIKESTILKKDTKTCEMNRFHKMYALL